MVWSNLVLDYKWLILLMIIAFFSYLFFKIDYLKSIRDKWFIPPLSSKEKFSKTVKDGLFKYDTGYHTHRISWVPKTIQGWVYMLVFWSLSTLFIGWFLFGKNITGTIIGILFFLIILGQRIFYIYFYKKEKQKS